MPINSKLRDRCAELISAGFTGSVGVSVALSGRLVTPYSSQEFKDAYGTSAGESEAGLPVIFTEGESWQSGYATFDHDANALVINSISASSNNGAAATFNAFATVAVAVLSDIPLEVPAVVFPNNNMPRYNASYYSLPAYSSRLLSPPAGATTITIDYFNVRVDGSVPVFTLITEGGEKVSGYSGTNAYTSGTITNTGYVYTTGIEMWRSVGWASTRMHSGCLTLRRHSPYYDTWTWRMDTSNNVGQMSTGVGHITMDDDISGIKLKCDAGKVFSLGNITINAE